MRPLDIGSREDSQAGLLKFNSLLLRLAISAAMHPHYFCMLNLNLTRIKISKNSSRKVFIHNFMLEF